MQSLSQGSPAETGAVAIYLTFMALLALFGSHRLALVWMYLRRQPRSASPRPPAELPRVTVQLPVYNERFVVRGLIEAVCQLQYPLEKLQIQVLDDSTDETTEIARVAVARMADTGISSGKPRGSNNCCSPRTPAMRPKTL